MSEARYLVSARSALARCGSPRGVRLLHVSDFHNNRSGFSFANALAQVFEPAVTVDTGDVSGIGGVIERLLIAAMPQTPGPVVFAPGNHDGSATAAAMERRGAVVLDESSDVQVSGVRIWGFRDPNRTRLFSGGYSKQLCEEAALLTKPPSGGPLVVAVHNAAMARPLPHVTAVLSGHVHTPLVQRRESTWFIRCGSTGGGGPFGRELHAVVVDLEPGSLTVMGIWTLRLAGSLDVIDAFGA